MVIRWGCGIGLRIIDFSCEQTVSWSSIIIDAISLYPATRKPPKELSAARLVEIADYFNLNHYGSVGFTTHQIRQRKMEDHQF